MTQSTASSGSVRAASVAAISCIGLLLGCAGAPDARRDPEGSQPEGSQPESSQSESSQPDSQSQFEAFDAAHFDRSLRIDNQWMPLKPGMRFVYEGTTIEDDGKAVPHRVVVHVTDLTKTIASVPTVVTWDLDYSDGELVEAELAFFAQDTSGAVWRMGEYPEEYEEGKVVAAPAWIHGFEDARAGIMMQAEPKPGTPSYAQGWAPAVDWTDRGQVDQVGQKVCVPVSCYQGVLVVAETSAQEPDAQQLKYYAPSVGNVRVGWRGAGEKTKETLELVRVEQLDAKSLAEVRAKALELERSAYQRSTSVYAHTPPAQPAPRPAAGD